ADDRMQVKLLQQVALDVGKRGAAKERALRDDHATAGTIVGLELLHDMLHEEQLGGLHLDGEILLNVPPFDAAEGGIGHDYVVALADLANVLLQGVLTQDTRCRDAMQDHVHQAKQRRNGFFFLPIERVLLQGAVVLNRALRAPHPQISLSQEAAGATRWVVDCLAASRVHQLHDEADDGPWGIELAGHAILAPQVPQQLLVDLRDGEDIVVAVEVDAVDDLQHIFQVIAGGTDDDVAFGEDASNRLAQG